MPAPASASPGDGHAAVGASPSGVEGTLHAEAAAIAAEVAAWARQWAAAWALDPPTAAERCGGDARFVAVQRRLFALQRDGIAAYGSLCAARGVGADGPPPWVPVAAWKRLPLQLPWTVRAPALRFCTSGTSDGAPGVVRLADASLYDAVAAATFAALLGLDAAPTGPRPRIVALLPDAAARPDSSLGHMAAALMRDVGDGGRDDAFLLHGQPGGELVDVAALHRHVAEAAAEGRAVVLIATTLALGALLAAWPRGATLPLPAGSRLCDTGGDKGRRLAFDRPATHAAAAAIFNLPGEAIVGELGMTELGSQRYEPIRFESAAALPAGAARGLYVGPPWLHTCALDPATMQRLPDGEVGLLAHVDLANVETLAFVLTADLGSVEATPLGAGVRLRGRLPGSEWRGCGLRVEDLLEELDRGAEAGSIGG